MDKAKEESKILNRICKLINKDKDVVVVDNIKKEDIYYSGKIQVNCLNQALLFQIKIPHHYPLTHPNSDNISIIFKNVDYIGFEHINLDGSVCFHPDKDDDFDRKFLYEIKCLKQWIRDYYVFEKEDDNYSYLIHRTEKDKINKLYFTDTTNKFTKNSYGVFDYSIFSDEKYQTTKLTVKKFFRLGFRDGQSDNWSYKFIEELKGKTCKKGIYYFIEKEPLRKNLKGRKGIENWSEFQPYLTDEFLEYLYNGLKKDFGKSFYHENSLLFLVGYKIPNNETYEEHWDLVRISKRNIPIANKRIPKDKRGNPNRFFEKTLKSNRINWGSTENIDYKRFFGRGKLDEKITDSKILIIGCGALGSSLAEILVRGGARHLFLEDFDTIRGGNLCRANYDLQDMVYLKTESLTKRLKSISPFINITSIDYKLNSIDLEKVKEVFDKNIDIIFDCSTDPEVTFILDKISFKGDCFSMAITNKAKSFVSITGTDLTKQANMVFDFVENEEPTYVEGTGCGYPTFEANYNDINALLHSGLKIINDNFSKKEINESFIIEPDFKNGFNINIEEYEYHFTDFKNSTIHIPKSVLREIEIITSAHYPNEFGGVFVGFKSKDSFIITDILVPDAYKNGRTIFVRHPGTLNDRLSEIHSLTNGKIEYLGEWHSHPDGPTNPSATDINAMKEIAENKKINADYPILLIAEVGKVPFDKSLYIYDNKNLRKYER